MIQTDHRQIPVSQELAVTNALEIQQSLEGKNIIN
jgi:hypothetical protein